MQLAATLARRFNSTTRERGFQYFRQRRVKVQSASSSQMEAIVRGSELYHVLLEWNGSSIAILCDCPHFLDREQPCKHLWAAILTADRENWLTDAAGARDPELDLDSLLNELSELDETAGGAGLTAPTGARAASSNLSSLAGKQPAPAPKQLPPAPPRPAAWKTQLHEIFKPAEAGSRPSTSDWPPDAEILYVVDIANSHTNAGLVLFLEVREPKKNGGWKLLKPLALKRQTIASLPSPEDREVLSAMIGSGRNYGYGSYNSYEPVPVSYHLSPTLARLILPQIVQTGRCVFPHDKEETEPKVLQWDAGEAWKFALEMHRQRDRRWHLKGFFRRGDERMELTEPPLVTPGGFLFGPVLVAPLDDDGAFPWIASLRKSKSIPVSDEDRDVFLAELLKSPVLPALELPDELRFEDTHVAPRPCLKVSRPNSSSRYDRDRLLAELSFDYQGQPVTEKSSEAGIFDAAKRQFLRRDRAAELSAAHLLYELGLRKISAAWENEAKWNVPPAKLPRAVRTLVEQGWHVVAEGKIFRSSSATRASVTSGLDWFELQGEVEYGESKAQLPQLLQALKRGETMVQLDDGSYGLLPEEWLSRFRVVASMGEAEGGAIRFSARQAGLLDALLATQPELDCDAAFARVRQELSRFEQVTAAEQPAGFTGQLRGYQREGLGWMHFLRQFSFGGCLADDMGVGKTAQVLALLESRRELRAQGEPLGPSLVVVPKSLIFNWKREVERFTPRLTVLDFTGIDRHGNEFSGYDVILTTYGTLRRDALRFKDTTFDYIVLDEAQAIKNAGTESAKAVRLLRGNHRLALSGTPVENHLGELWSLFEFLNPGLLGASNAFHLAGGALRNPEQESRKLLAHALRPFLLRRTKEQVATELPPKVEQTIYCELEPRQRSLYNDLRQHYRDSLLNKIGADGIAKSKIQVLEALLRLRQAACHPGLIDPKLAKDPGAKIEVLLEQLREVLAEGHKALVFSQFTRLLAIVSARLDSAGTVYEYLDGKTQNRQERVERFQNDPECRLFLISLKAGGLGLNLTEADYVFILDPWWNPAVEAQAVDRAHRIGQARQVFAYRLIARDTVEEKVLELQQSKRNLADAIIGADNSLIRDLKPEDIELLLS